MKIGPYVTKLNESDAYKEFRQEYKDAFLVAGFFVLDFESGQNVHQIDYYIPSIKKVAAFNLDGKVDVTDLGILAANWQQPANWLGGDFDGNAFADITDLGILAANWQAGVANPTMTFAEALAMFDVFSGIVIPEPASLSLLGMAGLLAMRRRRARAPRATRNY
jgi:hypothetical protein